MSMLLMTLLMVVSYFLVVGLVVLLESSLLGYLGGSVGPSSVCWGSYYLFMMDVIKFIFKLSSSNMNGSSVAIIMLLLLMEFLSVLSYFLLPISFLGDMTGSYLYFLILNIGVSILKMGLVKGFSTEFVKSVGESLVKIFIILEVLFSFICFLYILVFVGMGVSSWSGVFSVLGSGTFSMVFGLFPISVLLYMTLLLKVSSSPYDFVESESEFVGGLSTEFYGVFFGIWSTMEYSTVINGVWTVFAFGFMVFYGEVNLIISLFVVFILVLITLITSGMLVSYLSEDLPVMSGSVIFLVSLVVLVLLGIMFLLFSLEEAVGCESKLCQKFVGSKSLKGSIFDVIKGVVLSVILLLYASCSGSESFFVELKVVGESLSSIGGGKDGDSDGYFSYFFKYSPYSGGSPSTQGDKSSFNKVSCIWVFSVLFIFEFLVVLYLLICFSDLFVGMNMVFSFVVVLVYVFNNAF